MPIDREITKPALGSDQEPTAMIWKSTLRSPNSTPRGAFARPSRSRTRSSELLKSTIKSRTPSPKVTQSLDQTMSSMRKNKPRLSASFNKSVELKEIENDYIKNLQQQIYFLELESNYLRDQAKKATEMHPQMTAEADRMLSKLRSLQSEVDGLQIEVKRKEASMQLVTDENSKCLARLAEQENQTERMKRNFIDEIETIKTERDRISLDNVRLENQVDRLMSEKDSLSNKLAEAQTTIEMLKEQLSEKVEQYKMIKISLEEKRSQCVEAEAKARQIEDHYLTTTQRAHERELNQLKDEINILTRQLKDMEREVVDEKYLKDKVSIEKADLRKTTTIMNQQIEDLEFEVRREQTIRDEVDRERDKDLAQISLLTEKGKELSLELRSLEHQLADEKERSERFLQQIKKQEDANGSVELKNEKLNRRLVEAEATINTFERENDSLKRDKEILTDHVADLQSQLSATNTDLAGSKALIQRLEGDLRAVETEKRVDESIQSEKWSEFQNIASNMKQLSKTMAKASKSPRSSSRLT